MNGWLIVNNFVNSEKSKTLRNMLLSSAERHGIKLELKRTGDLNLPIGGGFGALPDFAIFWDKDTDLAERLETAGLRLFNGAAAIRDCDNKVRTYMRLAKGGVPFPQSYASPKTYEGIGFSDKGFVKNACEKLGFPVIIKEAYGSFGQQVYLAHSLDEAYAITDKIAHREFVIQYYAAESSGKDIRINVVGGKAVASIYRYNDNDFRSNISNGGSMKPYEPTDEQKQLAVNACKALGLDFGGVDVLFDNTVCEVNSNPHFKSTYDCTGIDMSDLIIKHIKESL